MIYFSSDLHFFHKNVIKYSNRPFADVEQMNSTIIKNINDLVKPEDELYLLGDFAFATVAKVEYILSSIACQNLHYVFGNHDEVMYEQRVKRFFKSMEQYKEISVRDESLERKYQQIILCHYPILEWNRAHKGSWMLHGHCHGNLKYPKELQNKRIVDIGTDCWNYKPVSFTELKNHFKNCSDLAHHGD